MLGAIDKDALGGQKNYGEQEIDISNCLRSKYLGRKTTRPYGRN
jgi:hypothetical protein